MYILTHVYIMTLIPCSDEIPIVKNYQFEKNDKNGHKMKNIDQNSSKFNSKARFICKKPSVHRNIITVNDKL